MLAAIRTQARLLRLFKDRLCLALKRGELRRLMPLVGGLLSLLLPEALLRLLLLLRVQQLLLRLQLVLVHGQSQLHLRRHYHAAAANTHLRKAQP